MHSLAVAPSATYTPEQNPVPPLRSRCPFLGDMEIVQPEPAEGSIGGSGTANAPHVSGTASSRLGDWRWGMPEHAPEVLKHVLHYLSLAAQGREIPTQQQNVAISVGRRGGKIIVDRDAAAFLAGQHQTEASPSLAVVPLAERASAAIDELTELARGWDGYDGMPVQSQVAEHAHRFLEVIGEHTQIMPDVVPLSNGGLQLEWFVGAYEVEVEIAPNCATLVFEYKRDGQIEESPISDSLDVSQIAPLFRELRR